MSAHTPGPWNYKSTYQGPLSDRWKGFPFSIDGGDGFQPALLFGDGQLNRGTAEANARLISAAPELLALAQAFVTAWDIWKESGYRAELAFAVSDARRVIAKAKGTP